MKLSFFPEGQNPEGNEFSFASEGNKLFISDQNSWYYVYYVYNKDGGKIKKNPIPTNKEFQPTKNLNFNLIK